MKLHQKLLLVSSLLVFFPIVVVFVTATLIFSNAFEDFVRNRTDETLSVTLNSIEENRLRLQATGELVASSREFREALAAREIPRLMSFLERIREYTILAEVDVFDGDGILVFSSLGEETRVLDEVELDLVRQGLRLRKFDRVHARPGSLAVKSVHPVVAGDLSCLGVLVITFPLNDEFIDLLRVVTNTHLILADTEGHTVACSMTDSAGRIFRAETEKLLARALAGEGLRKRETLTGLVDGISYALGFDWIMQERGRPAGIIAVAVPRTWFFRARNQVFLYLFSFAVGAVLLAILISFRVSRSITTPLRFLSHWAMQVEGGAPLEPVRLESRDEVGELARVFNKMVHRLQQMFRDLETSNRELDNKLHETRVLFDVSQTINYIPDTDELLIKILDKTIDATGADHASIMLVDEETDSLQLKLVRGIDYDRQVKVTLKKGVGIAGLVLDSGEPALIRQGRDDPRFVVFARERSVRSMVCVPLLQSGQPFGVLNVVIRDPQNAKGEFDRRDLRLSTAIANQIALVIDKAKLYQQSITDGMTGLYLHHYFKARLREEARRARRYGKALSLIMCDIDHFKNFNDRHGHQTGDLVLCGFAEEIRTTVRDKLDIPARYGGEEFAIICPETSPEGAFTVAERIRQAIESRKFSLEGGSLQVTASFGIATMDEGMETPEELIRCADQALYQSKDGGRNRVTLYRPDPS